VPRRIRVVCALVSAFALCALLPLGSATAQEMCTYGIVAINGASGGTLYEVHPDGTWRTVGSYYSHASHSDAGLAYHRGYLWVVLREDKSVTPTGHDQEMMLKVDPKSGKVLQRFYLGGPIHWPAISAAFADGSRRTLRLFTVTEGTYLRGWNGKLRNPFLADATIPPGGGEDGHGTAMNSRHVVVTFDYLTMFKTKLGKAKHDQWRKAGTLLFPRGFLRYCNWNLRITAAAFDRSRPNDLYVVPRDLFNPRCDSQMFKVSLRTRQATFYMTLPGPFSDFAFGPCAQ